MDSFKVINYKSFGIDVDDIELKPLTMLIGTNSSGKSSIARIFPLFKQTFEYKHTGTLMWYGNYVDFGDFRTTKNRKSTIDDSMSFIFTFRNNFVKDLNFYISRYLPFANRHYSKNISSNIRVQIDLNNDKIQKFNIVIDYKTKFNFEIVNHDLKKAKISICEIVDNTDNLLSEYDVYYERNKHYLLPTFSFNEFNNESSYFSYDIIEYFCNILKLKKEQYIDAIRSLNGVAFNLEKSKFKEIVTKILTRVNGKNTFDTIYQSENCKEFNSDYYTFLLYLFSTSITPVVNSYLKKQFEKTQYLKPIRATIERYNRIQGLNTEEIDADGKNLPMFFNTMSDDELNEFEHWCFEKFGVIFTRAKFENHLSIVVKNDFEGSEAINIADTGCGYTQILPLIVLMWEFNKSVSKGDEEFDNIIVIEQPELHLHPKLQVKLIDCIYKVIEEGRKNNIKFKFLLETHSTDIINRVGSQISSKKIKENDINLLSISKSTNNNSLVKSIKFDKNGILEEWPEDFLFM